MNTQLFFQWGKYTNFFDSYYIMPSETIKANQTLFIEFRIL